MAIRFLSNETLDGTLTVNGLLTGASATFTSATINTGAGNVGLGVFTSTPSTTPNVRFGRNDAEYVGFKIEDRANSVVFRQDETTGNHEAIFDIWSSTSDNRAFLFKASDSAGASSSTWLTIENSDATFARDVSVGRNLTVTGNITGSSGTGHFSVVNASGYQLNGTYIVDSSRNLVNISNLTLTGSISGAGATFTGAITATGITTTGSATFGSPLTIKAASPYIKWEKADGTRLAYIQHNETNLIVEADTGIIVLDANTQIYGTLGISSNVNTSGLLTATQIDTNAYLSNGTAADLHGRYLGQAIYGSGTGSGDNYGSVADVFRYKTIAVWRKDSSTNAWSNPSTGNSLIEGNYAHKWSGIDMLPAYSEYVFYFANTLGYSFVSQTILQHSTNGNSFDCYLERASSTTNPYDTTGWTTMVTKTGISSWPGLTAIQDTWEVGGGYPGLFRIRLVPTWNNSNSINLGSFQAYGSYGNFGHAWSTTYDRKVNFQSMIGVGTNPSRALDVTQTALIQGPGNVNAGTLALGPRSSGSGKWSSITGAHYNQASGSGNGSGSAGIMMIGTYGANGENDVYIGGGLYEVNAATAIRFYTHTTDTSTAGGSPRMTISSNGYVGIGNTSGAGARTKLGVTFGVTGNAANLAESVSYAAIEMYPYRNSSTYGMFVGAMGTTSGYIQSANTDGTAAGAFSINPWGGNVGIGTTLPANKLTVNGDIGYTGVIGQGSIYGNTGNSSYANMQLYNPATGYSTFNNQSYGYYFQTGGGTKLTILNNGSVGIGNTSPQTTLHVGTTTTVTNQFTNQVAASNFFVNGNANGGASFFQCKTAAVNINMMGNNDFACNQFTFYHKPLSTSQNVVGTITTFSSSTQYNTTSDYRLKENIIPLSDSITRLKQLKPSRFNFIEDPERTMDGFLAHEVQNIVPEAVNGEKDAIDENGNELHQGIDQAKLVPLLVAAIQELEARVKELENK